MVGEIISSSWERFGKARDGFGEVDGFLVDFDVLEHERHSSRKRAGLLFTCSPFSCSPSIRLKRFALGCAHSARESLIITNDGP